MSALYLTEDDVLWLLDLPAAIEVVERALRSVARGQADHQPRRRVRTEGAMLHVLSAASDELGFVGYKAYTTTRQGARFLVHLFDAATGQPVAVIEANHLGQLRTGAATGVATRVMARPEAALVGCFGTGFQAKTQVQAVCAVRKIERVEVYSRHQERRERFAAELTELCNVHVVPKHQPEGVAAEKDIVITATTSKVPLFDGRVLDEGVHLNVIGSNYPTKAEVDVTTIRRADRIVCDSLAACQLEAGDFLPALEAGVFEWSRVHELSAVLAGEETGRAHADEITLFKSVGLGLEDLAVAVHVYQRARQEKLGQPLPF